jgi:hypothetical protein
LTYIRNFRKRRGVGAIIGGVILIAILLTTVFLYFMTVLNNEQRRVSYDIETAQDNQDKALEKLVATNTGVFVNATGTFMNSVMKNEGSLSLVVSHTALYCIDCPSPNNPQLDGSDVTLNAKETALRIVGPVVPTNTYRVDFITERGNIFYTQDCLVGVSELSCEDSIGTADFALSSSPSTFVLAPGGSETSTITVTSLFGFSGTVALTASAPVGITASVDPTPVTPPADSTTPSTLTIDADPTIADGTYIVTVTGTSGVLTHTTDVTVVIFTASPGEEPELDDEILKPQIQGVFPNPHGSLSSSSSKQGLWGVVVANPSDAAMSIRRVVVTAFNPYGTNPAIFPNNCPATNVLPAAGGSWSCPSQNTLIWSGSFTLPAHSAQAFLATAGKPASNDDFPSYSINFNVFTTFGQYAKAGYSGSMTKATSEIANAYLSTVANSVAPASMIGTRTFASGANDVTLFATIANLGDAGVITTGTKLIVTIPKAFTDVIVAPNPPTPGLGLCTTINLGDGSTQITCPLTSDLTSGQARSVRFTMDAPVNTDGTNKLFSLLVLADGTDGNAAPMGAVGPVSENVIIVTP